MSCPSHLTFIAIVLPLLWVLGGHFLGVKG